MVEALSYPADKRFHRFIGLAPEDFEDWGLRGVPGDELALTYNVRV